jgi:small subunit ribosomal protein S13
MSSLKYKIFTEKTLEQTLQRVYGIGKANAYKICRKLGFLPQMKANLLRQDQKQALLNYLENKPIENVLRRQVKESREFLMNLKNTRGIRNKLGYPVRGQRTHTNAQTKKKLKHETKAK